MPEKESSKKKPQVKRKLATVPTNLSIYMFDTFDDYIELCNLITSKRENTYNFFKNSTLFLYKSKYYLCLYINNKDINTFKLVHYKIIEFGSHINNSDLFERKLKEYGKLIFKTNAISGCIKHFK